MEFFLIYVYAAVLNLREIISHTWGFIFLVGLAYVVIFGIHLFHRQYSNERYFYRQREKPLDYIPIYRDIQRRLARVLKISITVIILVFVFVPTVEQAKWIVGGAVIYNMSQNEELRQLPENVAGAANRFLESIEPASEKSDKTEATE